MNQEQYQELIQVLQTQQANQFGALQQQLLGQLQAAPPAANAAQGDDEAEPALEDRLQRLVESVELLIDDKKILNREAHEVETLLNILRKPTLAQIQGIVQQRLETIYIATTRSWHQATAYRHRQVDEDLGLPPPPAPLPKPTPRQRKQKHKSTKSK